jgi:hypothetical protein
MSSHYRAETLFAMQNIHGTHKMKTGWSSDRLHTIRTMFCLTALFIGSFAVHPFIPVSLADPTVSHDNSEYARQDSSRLQSVYNPLGLFPVDTQRIALNHFSVSLRRSETDSYPELLKHNPLPPLEPIPGQGPYDPIERVLEKQNPGTRSPAPLTNLLAKGITALGDWLTPKATPDITFIPTPAEMNVMQLLWQQGALTQDDLYAALDSTIDITAQDFQQVLKRLCDRHILSKTQLSPRFEFTLLTPVGAKGVEMSSMNRKNRLFRYTLQVPKKDMIRSFNRFLYKANLDSTSGIDLSRSQIDRLHSYLIRLSQLD